MTRLITTLAAAAALTLSGCQTLQTIISVGTVSPQAIATAEASYNVVLTFMVEYRCRYDNTPAGCVSANGTRIPKNACRVNQTPSLANGFCASRSAVVRLQRADAVVQTAFDRVQSDVYTCQGRPTSLQCNSITSSWNTLQAAITAARGLAAEFGFNG